jgi:hypothetical protein
MQRICRHDWRIGLGVLLTLLAYNIGAPQVRAGCDYPAVAATTAHSVTNNALAHQLSNSIAHRSMPHPKPCTGPHCSRSPLAPSAPPAAPIVSGQEWAYLAVVAGGAQSQGAAHRLEDDPHKPIFRTIRIYHPPR